MRTVGFFVVPIALAGCAESQPQRRVVATAFRQWADNLHELNRRDMPDAPDPMRAAALKKFARLAQAGRSLPTWDGY